MNHLTGVKTLSDTVIMLKIQTTHQYYDQFGGCNYYHKSDQPILYIVCNIQGGPKNQTVFEFVTPVHVDIE